jgi:hypothetical protein
MKKGRDTVNKSRPELAKSTRVFLVLELEHGHSAVGDFIQLVVSRAGSDSVLKYHWDLKEGLPTSAMLTDIIGKVAALVNDGTIMFLGLQDGLPGV